jgi:glycosyltransferase involved in cell wall biosynthesis
MVPPTYQIRGRSLATGAGVVGYSWPFSGKAPLPEPAAAIGSAIAQSESGIEIIVSDDSPDETSAELVSGFNDERLRYRHNSPPLGVARNHWASFSESRGEFIVVLNHDDWLAPTFFERMMGAVQAEPLAVLAFCDHWLWTLMVSVSCQKPIASPLPLLPCRWATERLTRELNACQRGRDLCQKAAQTVRRLPTRE